MSTNIGTSLGHDPWDEYDLSGKVAVVTAATGGLGRAVSTRLTDSGAMRGGWPQHERVARYVAAEACGECPSDAPALSVPCAKVAQSNGTGARGAHRSWVSRR